MKSWEELIPPEDSAREKFSAFLMKKPCTRKQAYEYLSRMKIPNEQISRMMNEAEDSGMIDDSAYARLFADGHLSWGNAKISYELAMRGVSRENIRLALDEIDDEAERACEIAEGWRKSGIEGRKIRTRLISRGFTGRAVDEALKEE